MAQGFTFSISRAPRAAAATPSRSLSMEASTAAMTAPSTKGALLSSTRPAPSGSCSIAIWVLSTALPRSTSTSTPSAPRTSWIAPAMAVASVPSRPSAVPPATAILTLPWVIWAASSRTPSASCRLCETRTRLTVPISPGHDLDGMGGFRAGPMLDLQAAGFAVGEHGIGAGRLDGLEEATSDFHGQVVLLDLDAERAGNSAASLVDFVEMDPWDPAQQSRRRVSHAVRLEMAGCVIEQPRFHRLEGDIELTGLVQHPEVFADIVGACADRLRAGNLEQVTVVVLEHQPARRRAGDDVDVGGKTAEPADVLGAVFPCQVDVGVDDGRNSAALLLGDDHVDAVALEDVHDHFAQTPLVVVDPAAVDGQLRRTGDFAELAAGAQVEPRRDRGLGLRAVALRFGAEELRAAKDVGGSRHRADGVAGGALGAGLYRRRLLDRVGKRANLISDHAAIASLAARYPVAIANPPRDLLPTGS